MAPTTQLKGCKVWRYTVERLDIEDNIIRLEQVPLAKEIEVKYFLDRIAKEEKEELEWWDTKLTKSRVFSIDECRKFLRLESQELVENMVFWILLKGRKVKQVIHATQATRKLSTELYSRLIPQTQRPEIVKKSRKK